MKKIKDSRESILEKIKNNTPAPRPLPNIPMFEIKGSPLSNFIGHLKGFDGEYRLFATRGEAINWANENMAERGGIIYSTVEDIKGNKTLKDFPSPADMHIIDTCITEAILGVGETGSLLLDDKILGHPATALFSTDLIVLFDRRLLLASMQEAYSHMNTADYQYSAFFSGPSATADIEAVHVTGAQGEISLTALIYNCSEDELKEDADIAFATPLGPAIKLEREADPQKGCDSV